VNLKFQRLSATLRRQRWGGGRVITPVESHQVYKSHRMNLWPVGEPAVRTFCRKTKLDV